MESKILEFEALYKNDDSSTLNSGLEINLKVSPDSTGNVLTRGVVKITNSIDESLVIEINLNNDGYIDGDSNIVYSGLIDYGKVFNNFIDFNELKYLKSLKVEYFKLGVVYDTIIKDIESYTYDTGTDIGELIVSDDPYSTGYITINQKLLNYNESAISVLFYKNEPLIYYNTPYDKYISFYSVIPQYSNGYILIERDIIDSILDIDDRDIEVRVFSQGLLIGTKTFNYDTLEIYGQEAPSANIEYSSTSYDSNGLYISGGVTGGDYVKVINNKTNLEFGLVEIMYNSFNGFSIFPNDALKYNTLYGDISTLNPDNYINEVKYVLYQNDLPTDERVDYIYDSATEITQLEFLDAVEEWETDSIDVYSDYSGLVVLYNNGIPLTIENYMGIGEPLVGYSQGWSPVSINIQNSVIIDSEDRLIEIRLYSNGSLVDTKYMDYDTKEFFDDSTPVDPNAPLKPTDLLFSEDGLLITGRSDDGEVANAYLNDVLIGTSNIIDGTFEINLGSEYLNGEEFKVNVVKDGLKSPSVKIKAPKQTTIAKPISVGYSEDGTYISGYVDINDYVYVYAFKDGIEVGYTYSYGSFYLYLDQVFTNGELIEVFVEYNGETSESVFINAPIINIKPNPAYGVEFSSDGSYITGFSDAGYKVLAVGTTELNDEYIIGETVNNFGDFEILISPPLTNGEEVKIIVFNEETNKESDYILVYAPIITEPEDPIPPRDPYGVTISSDGSKISGMSDIGTNIAAFYILNGEEQNIGFVNSEDGSFEIDVIPPLINGELIYLIAFDPETDLESDIVEIYAPVIIPEPVAPKDATDVSFNEDGTIITGTSEDGGVANIWFDDLLIKSQSVIGTEFSITLDTPYTNGETLQVIITKDDLESNPVDVIAPVIIPEPVAPKDATDVSFNEDGTIITGTSEDGGVANIWFDDLLIKSQSVIGTEFSITLDTPYTNGETLQVIITKDDLESNPVDVIAPVIIPEPVAPKDATDVSFNEDGTIITGTSEDGGVANIWFDDLLIKSQSVIGTEFSITLDTPYTNGETLQVIITKDDLESNPVDVIAPVIIPEPVAPKDATDVSFNEDGTIITGTSEDGGVANIWFDDLLIKSQSVIGTEFSITLDTPYTNGETLQVIITKDDLESNPVDVIAPVIIPEPVAPKDATDVSFNEDGTIITGTSEDGGVANIWFDDLLIKSQSVIGTEFSITLDTPYTNGETLQVIITKDDLESNPVDVIAPVIIPEPVAPKDATDVSFNEDGTIITGTSEDGGVANIWFDDLLIKSQSVIGTEFSITLDTPYTNGETLQVIITKDDLESNPVDVIAPVIIPEPVAPKDATDVSFNEDGTIITGTSEDGGVANIWFDDLLIKSQSVIGTEFSITLDTPYTNGETLQVIITKDDLESNPVDVIAPVIIPEPVAPKDATDVSFNEDGTIITGTSEDGGVANIWFDDLLIKSQSVIGTEFSITLDTPYTNGETLQVIITKDDLESNPVDVIAPVIIPEPVAPKDATDVSFNEDGTIITGTSEDGGVANIWFDDLLIKSQSVIGTEFSITLDTPYTNGETLQVIITKDDLESNPVDVIAPVIIPEPVAPKDATDVSFNEDGTIITGTSEDGGVANIWFDDLLIKSQAVIGTEFSITLDTPYTNGETLQVIITKDDLESNPVDVIAPVIIPEPVAPKDATDVSFNEDGTIITGTSEDGGVANIWFDDLLIKSQAVIGTEFSITLDTPYTNGETLQVIITKDDLESNPVDVIAPVIIPEPVAPKDATDVSFNEDGTIITGTSEDGGVANIWFDDLLIKSQAVIGTEFSITLDTPYTNGETLQVIITKDDLESNPVDVIAPVIIPEPVAPKDATDVSFNEDGTIITGTSEDGGVANIWFDDLLIKSQAVIGTEFSITLDTPYTNGETLQVIITKDDLESNPVDVIAPVIIPEPVAPNPPTNLEFDGDDFLMGLSTDADFANLYVDDLLIDTVSITNTLFVFNINKEYTNGELLKVSVTKDGLESEKTSIFARIKMVNPSGVSINADGSVVIGYSEIGSDVVVEYNDFIIGSATSTDGTFTINLSTPKTNGELLIIRSYKGVDISDDIIIKAPVIKDDDYEFKNIQSYFNNNKLISQTFEFKTEIQNSISNKETRLNLSTNPRHYIEFIFEVNDKERMILENDIISNDNKPFYIPFKYNEVDCIRLNNTSINGSFEYLNIKVGDNVFIDDGFKNSINKITEISLDFKNIKVSSIDSSFGLNLKLCPLILSNINKDTQSERFNGDYSVYNIIFENIRPSDNFLKSNTSYTPEKIDDVDFYDFLIPNIKDNYSSRDFTRNIEVLDNEISIKKYFIKNEKTTYTESFGYFINGTYELNRIKSIFENNRGMAGEFYTIKPDIAFKIIENANAIDSSLLISSNNNENIFNNGLFEYLYLLKKDGFEVLKVKNIIKNGLNEEVILENELGFNIDILDVIGFYPIVKSRFNDDSLVFEHYGVNNAMVNISLKNIR